jgi:hypothetical protein
VQSGVVNWTGGRVEADIHPHHTFPIDCSGSEQAATLPKTYQGTAKPFVKSAMEQAAERIRARARALTPPTHPNCRCTLIDEHEHASLPAFEVWAKWCIEKLVDWFYLIW